MDNMFSVLVTAIFVENIVLSQFLGICPFIGVSKKTETALGMGMSVAFVMVVSSLITFCIHNYILVPFKMEYLQTLSFILVIAVLVQLVEMALAKYIPALYSALGIYLPLITTNCAVLGVAISNIQDGLGLFEGVWYSFALSMGFTLAIVLFAGVRERLENSDIPEFLKGMPITLISAGLISMAFLGFQGLSF